MTDFFQRGVVWLSFFKIEWNAGQVDEDVDWKLSTIKKEAARRENGF